MLDELANNRDSEGIVHRLIEVVTVELDDVGMILSFKQLHSLFFVFIELV